MRFLVKLISFCITFFGLAVFLLMLAVSIFFWTAPRTLPDLRVAESSVTTSMYLSASGFGLMILASIVYAIAKNTSPSQR